MVMAGWSSGREVGAAPPRPTPGSATPDGGFTLIELLVVVAIISLLVSLLLPALATARAKGRATKCLANLHVLGHGLVLYANDFGDVLLPGRLPRLNDCEAYAELLGQRKYRPTFLAMMSEAVRVPPFADPLPCRNMTDRFGERGDRQNYSYPTYVCPAVADWTDERNGSYGYNYHFLGNSRLRDAGDPTSYKNWPVSVTAIRFPSRTVAVADGQGTAAAFPAVQRREYLNNSSDADRLGNEGFNLDPPRVDPVNGEMANFPSQRSAADPRHLGRTNVLWVDGHVSAETLKRLGYEVLPDGQIGLGLTEDVADNSRWTGNGQNVPWTLEFVP